MTKNDDKKKNPKKWWRDDKLMTVYFAVLVNVVLYQLSLFNIFSTLKKNTMNIAQARDISIVEILQNVWIRTHGN
jgi:hypothetical protein